VRDNLYSKQHINIIMTHTLQHKHRSELVVPVGSLLPLLSLFNVSLTSHFDALIDST
jgi:hypothetical protein